MKVRGNLVAFSVSHTSFAHLFNPISNHPLQGVIVTMHDGEIAPYSRPSSIVNFPPLVDPRSGVLTQPMPNWVPIAPGQFACFPITQMCKNIFQVLIRQQVCLKPGGNICNWDECVGFWKSHEGRFLLDTSISPPTSPAPQASQLLTPPSNTAQKPSHPQTLSQNIFLVQIPFLVDHDNALHLH